MQQSSGQYSIFGGTNKQLPNALLHYYDPRHDKSIKKELLDIIINHRFTVFFFYPDNFSHVCPTELHELNRLYKEFQAVDCEVVTVSRDSIFAHKKRVEIDPQLKNFALKMLSDRDGALLKPLDLFQEGESFKRVTFITSNTGKILYADLYPGNIGRNIKELLRVVQSMSFLFDNPTQLCPENRDPDSKDALHTDETTKKSGSIFQ